MSLRTLLTDYQTASDADATAASALAAATSRKGQTAAALSDALSAFVGGLNAVGGRALDGNTLYEVASGTFTTTTIPTFDDDLPTAGLATLASLGTPMPSHAFGVSDALAIYQLLQALAPQIQQMVVQVAALVQQLKTSKPAS